jgi:hypothetical protein
MQPEPEPELLRELLGALRVVSEMRVCDRASAMKVQPRRFKTTSTRSCSHGPVSASASAMVRAELKWARLGRGGVGECECECVLQPSWTRPHTTHTLTAALRVSHPPSASYTK